MPITQARVLSLLGAAQDYQRALEKLIALAKEMQHKSDNRRIEPGSALATIASQASELALLQYPVESALVIRLEAIHFTKEGRRNLQKTAKSRDNKMHEIEGLPKPNRGKGEKTSTISARQINPIIRPDPAITGPGSDFIGIAKLAPDGEYQPGRGGAEYIPKITSNARELEQTAIEVRADSKLDFEEEEPPAMPRYPVRPGYDLPESICQHELVIDMVCLKCGKPMEQGGEGNS